MGDKDDTIAVRLNESRRALLARIRVKVGGDADVAEDILQDAMVRAVQSAPELRDEERLIPWFNRIVSNAVIDYYRHRAVVPKALQYVADHGERSVAPEEHALVCACVADVIPTLKPEYAELIEQIELGEADPEEVAKRLGITRNNLKVRRHRARQQLRERLEETCRTCAVHGCLDCSCSRTTSRDA